MASLRILLLCVFVATASCEVKRFLFVSDVHLDLLVDTDKYLPETFCRPAEKGVRPTRDIDDYVHDTRKDKIGQKTPFGRYGCDSKESLVVSTYEEMKKVNNNPDFIIMGGDFVGHALTGEDHYRSLNRSVALLDSAFPHTTIIPVVGNNDVIVDYQAECYMKDYQILASLWEKWIPANQMKTFLRSGSYYLRKDGITFIVLNTNYYSFKNDKNSNDCGQMEWLKETLEREKRFGNKVCVVGHVVPAQDDTRRRLQWSQSALDSFTEITAPFFTEIVAQFYGHIHKGTFRLMRKNETQSVLFVSNAISPIYDNNPSFVEYQYDNETKEILNAESYFMDIYSSNQKGKAEWKKLYSFADTFDVSDLSVHSMNNVFKSFTTQPEKWTAFDAFRAALFDVEKTQKMCAQIVQSQDEYNQCIKEYAHQ